MKNKAIAALLALSASIVPCAQASIGMGVLMIWPTARSTALAGAMTGLADEADATYFNPAGLAFQTTAKADIDYGSWLPGMYQGLFYASAAGGAPVRVPFLQGRNAFIAGSLTYLTTGEVDIVNERGDYLGRFVAWQGAASVCIAAPLTSALGAGIGLKLARGVHASMENDWPWEFNPELVLEPGGNATTVAADLGILFRPSRHLGFGATVANIGPRVSYRLDGSEAAGPTANLPRMVRLGLCWTPVENQLVRLRVMPELDKVLVGMFRDTTGTKTFGRKLGEEWKDVWKAVGVEATVFNVVSFRLGYFEDLTNKRGGITLEKEGQTYHYGVWDVLTRKHLGKFERIGLCWGFGFGSDKLRFDFSSDGAIYDFPTSNWKLQLVSNDIGGLFRRRS